MAEFQSMRSSNKSRSRNKPGNSGHNSQSNNNNNNQRRPMGNIVNRVFESAGPDGKVRGTPQQIIDKYQALARDAQVSGDRVAAENYLQHSEHYSRLLGEAQRQQNEQRAGQERDDANRGEDQSEARAGGNGQGNNQNSNQGGAPREAREHQGGQQPRQPRPVQGFGLTTIETDESDADFGPIPTPESGEAQPRMTAPATEHQPAESKGEEPRIVALTPEAAPAEQPVAAEAPAPVEPAPTPVETRAEPAPETPAEPAPEAKPKRPRTRRKAKVDPAAEAAPSEAPAEAQPAEQN
jgi:hypothetical protein